MGLTASQEHLVLRWADLCADPRGDDFAGKIELNGRGVIVMSCVRGAVGKEMKGV